MILDEEKEKMLVEQIVNVPKIQDLQSEDETEKSDERGPSARPGWDQKPVALGHAPLDFAHHPKQPDGDHRISADLIVKSAKRASKPKARSRWKRFLFCVERLKSLDTK